MTVRLNDYHDLPVLQALYEAAGHAPDMGWRWTGNFAGWWAILEDEARRPLGCLQLSLSQPQAVLETLCVPLVFQKRMRVAVIRALCRFAVQFLAALGVQSVRFQVNEQYGDWERIVSRYGARRLHAHPTYIMELPHASIF